MTAFLGSVLAGVIAQAIRAFLKWLGLEQEFLQLIAAMFIIVSTGLLLFTLYLGLKALLMIHFGIELHWLSWLCDPISVCG